MTTFLGLALLAVIAGELLHARRQATRRAEARAALSRALGPYDPDRE